MNSKKYFHTWKELVAVMDSHSAYWEKEEDGKWMSVTSRATLEIIPKIGKISLYIYDGPIDIIIYKTLGAVYMVEAEDETYLSMVDNAGNDFHLVLELKEEK